MHPFSVGFYEPEPCSEHPWQLDEVVILDFAYLYYYCPECGGTRATVTSVQCGVRLARVQGVTLTYS